MSLSRRSVLLGTSLSASAAVLAACSPANDDAGGQSSAVATASAGGKVEGDLRLYIGGDTNVRDLWQKTLVPEFNKLHPNVKVSIQHDLHSERTQQTLAKLSAATKAKQDPGFDFIDESGLVMNAAKANLLVTPTNEAIPNLSSVPKETLDTGLGQGIPYRASSVLLAYNPQKVTNVPESLEDVLKWIESNKGRFAYNSPASGGSGGAFVTSVLDMFITDTEARKKMSTEYDKSLQKLWEPGWKRLKELGPSLYREGVYPNGNSQVLDLLASGQIDMNPAWSDQFISGQQAGTIPAHIKAKQIKDPSFTGGASHVGIPTAGKNQAAALALVNYALSPEGQQKISEGMAGYPVIELSKMPADIQKKFADADPSNLRLGYFADMSADMNKLWDEKIPTKR